MYCVESCHTAGAKFTLFTVSYWRDLMGSGTTLVFLHVLVHLELII